MKTILLQPLLPLFLVLSTTHSLFAQHQYIPFPDSNAIWVVRSLNEFGKEEGGGQYFIQKDTIIDSIKYKKVVGTNDSTLYTPGGPKESWFAFRNDIASRRVYIYDQFAKKEYLLHDFTLKEGDTIPKISYGGEGRYGNSVITNIDTIMIDTNEHLVYYAHSQINGNLYPFIEGIGSTVGPIHQQAYFFEGGVELVCLMLGEDRVPYYTSPGLNCKLYHYTGIRENSENLPEVKVYPHPLNEHSVITLTSGADRIDQLTIHDMTGKVVLEKAGINSRQFELGQLPFEQGVYFYRLSTRKGKYHSGRLVV